MPLPKVFVTRKISTSAFNKLSQFADVEVWPYETPPPPDVLLQQFQQSQAVLSLLTDPIDANIINKAASDFKIISQMAVGVDNIDIASATSKGIPVGHTPDVLTEVCADFTWTLLTAIARRLPEAHMEVQNNVWRPWGPDVLIGADIYGATLGIIGLGRIGQAVARRAAGFNMNILYYSKTRKRMLEEELKLTYVPLETLLQQSDFVSLHVNLSDETHHLLNTDTIKLMKSSAYLVNISRGKVVDSDALTEAILSNQIAGAALDVFDPEPIPQSHPLLHQNNVIITPHIASASAKVREKMALMAVDNIIAAIKDEQLPYCYNPSVYR
jgi:glyoxylate reductase